MPRGYWNFSRNIERISAYFFLFMGSINLFFGALQLANIQKIDFFFVYMPEIIDLTLFSPYLDRGIWGTSLAVTLFIPVIMRIVKHVKIPPLMIFSHFILPGSCIVYATKFFQQGLQFLTLSGFLAIVMTIRYSQKLLSVSSIESLVRVAIGILAFIVTIQLGSLIVLILYPLLGPIFFSANPFRCFPRIHINLFYATYPLLLTTLIAFLSSWFWMPLKKILFKASNRFASVRQLIIRFQCKPSAVQKFHYSYNNFDLQKIVPILVLLSSAFLGIFLIRYAQIFGGELLGVDDEWYIRSLDRVSNLSKLKAILISEPRWTYLLMLYFIKIATSQSAAAVVGFGSIPLIFFFSITVYFLVSVGKNNRFLALLSSILTTFSIQTTVGLFAGIYANWLAISGVVLFFFLFLYAFQKQSYKFMLLSIFISFLVLFSHPWTWGILMAIVITYAFVTSLLVKFGSQRSSINKRELVWPMAVILSNLIFALIILLMAKNIPFISGAHKGIHSGYVDIVKSFSIENFLNFRAILSSTLAFYVGGLFAIPPLLTLAILGVWASRNYSDRFNRLLLSWITIPLGLSLFTISFWQWRLLYIIPFQIPVSIGVFFIIEKINQFNKRNWTKPRVTNNVFKLLLIISTILLASNYALGSLVSFLGNLLIFH